MVSRYDAVLAAIPAVVLAGAVAGHVAGSLVPTVLGLVAAALVVGHELFVVGVPG